jgi:hypothetical protein
MAVAERLRHARAAIVSGGGTANKSDPDAPARGHYQACFTAAIARIVLWQRGRRRVL